MGLLEAAPGIRLPRRADRGAGGAAPDLRGAPGARVPVVSVVIPCFNGERFVGDAVASVLAQTHRDLEAIVVDDGSTDRSLAIVRGFGDARVRVLPQRNAGVAAARNTGVAASSGAVVAFLDQDDLWLPEKLERQLAALAAAPDAGLVYSDCLVVAEDGRPLERLSARAPLRRGRVFEELIVDTRVPISSVLLPRTIFDTVGGFCPRFRYVEDLDLILRVAARHPIEVVAEPLARYRVHDASVTRTLGLEVSVRELIELCEDWIAREPARAPAVARSLGRALYIAGKAAFYEERVDLARRYLGLSMAHAPRARTRLFALAAHAAPGLVLRGRALVNQLRGGAAQGPGPTAR